jgi:hypothetical protein
MMQTITGIAVARRTWQFSALPYSLILFTDTVQTSGILTYLKIVTSFLQMWYIKEFVISV